MKLFESKTVTVKCEPKGTNKWNVKATRTRNSKGREKITLKFAGSTISFDSDNSEHNLEQANCMLEVLTKILSEEVSKEIEI